MRILVTGGTGFVGRELLERIRVGDHELLAITRSSPLAKREGVKWIEGVDFRHELHWSSLVDGIDCVVNLAGVSRPGPGETWEVVNYLAAAALADAAARGGTRRFIQVSSAEAVASVSDLTLAESTVPNPTTPYGVSKLKGEQAVTLAANDSEMDVVVLRPPLVYGPGARGSFLRLLRAITRGVPLPLAGLDNQRHYIYLENFADALMVAIEKPGRCGSYFVSDSDAVSTPQLAGLIADAAGRRARLFRLPPKGLAAAARLTGFLGLPLDPPRLERLVGSRLLDSSAFRADFGWHPRTSITDGVAATVEQILADH